MGKDSCHGPGEYLPHPCEGIVNPDQLPPPLVEVIDRDAACCPCPDCGQMASRLRRMCKGLHDVGDPVTGRPRELTVHYAQFHCRRCGMYFSTDLGDLCPKRSNYTHRVIRMAIRLVVEDNCPYRPASWQLWRDHQVFVPFATIQNWVEGAGKKAIREVQGPYQDHVLEDFSGYVAVDELYDGPWCVLSIVDNHRFRRLVCRVLDKSQINQDVVIELFSEFRAMLDQRGLKLAGITTDGSNLYPQAIKQVFGAVPHQVCQFHVIALITKAAREAAVHLYKKRMAILPKLKSGRPRRGAETRKAQQVKAEREKLLNLYRRRYTLVAHDPKPEELAELMGLLEEYPEIAQVRELMQQVYAMYECVGRGEALVHLTAIRAQAASLSAPALLSVLNGPCIEKSLVFLDHPQLPSTSNAVERSNRRHRKMQGSVYRVRAKRQIERRVALDLLREERALGREECLMTLHAFRQAA